jgi:hypothetical protein
MLCKHSVAISSLSKPFRASIKPQDKQLNQPLENVFKVFGSGLFFLMLLFYAIPAFPADVTLAWDSNSETDLEGYGVYFMKGAPGPPYDLFGNVTTAELSDPTNPTLMITGLEKGARYYFALTAYDTAGNESNFSDAVCADVGDVIAPCSTENPGGGGGSSGGGGGGGCFIDTSSAGVARFNPETAALIALGCIVAFIRIAQRHFKRFLLFVRFKPDDNQL